MPSLRILIVTYNWPPRNSIGTHRPYSWAKHWSEAGAHVSVVTPRKRSFDAPLDLAFPVLPGVSVSEVPNGSESSSTTLERQLPRPLETASAKSPGLAKRFLSQLNQRVFKLTGKGYDKRGRWANSGLAASDALVRGERLNVVVSTYGPAIAHGIAYKLKRKHPNLVWIADYRDLWSLDHFRERSRTARNMEERKEKQMMAHADLVTTVSPRYATILSEFLQKPCEVVKNGFDFSLEELSHRLQEGGLTPREQSSPLRIVYTGRIYFGQRDPAPLFRAISELRAQGQLAAGDVSVEFFGPESEKVSECIAHHDAADFAKAHGYVPRDQALSTQRGASALLLMEGSDDEADGVLTGKLFEYLASGVPILSIGSSDRSDIASVLRQCQAGIVCGNDVERIKKAILDLRSNNTDHFFAPQLEQIAHYSRKTQAMHMLQAIASSTQERHQSIG